MGSKNDDIRKLWCMKCFGDRKHKWIKDERLSMGGEYRCSMCNRVHYQR